MGHADPWHGEAVRCKLDVCPAVVKSVSDVRCDLCVLLGTSAVFCSSLDSQVLCLGHPTVVTCSLNVQRWLCVCGARRLPGRDSTVVPVAVVRSVVCSGCIC